jgi:hypothetical protein
MQFSELFTALHEHHANVVVIYHGATLNDKDICCSPAFKQYSGVIITAHDPVLVRSRGSDLDNPRTLDKEGLKSFIMDSINGAAESWIISHSGQCYPLCPYGPSRLIRKVYEYKGGNDANIRRVPAAEYRETLTDHGNTIDV